MDFKSLVNKESFKSILQHHLKNQARAKFGNSILKNIQARSESELVFSDNITDSVANNIAQSEENKEFLKTFLNSLNNLFEDKEKYIPKREENQGTISQCSSASSVSTSIDYISFDQFQDIIHTLSNGVNAEKLEALETFSRLPSLEHIIKRTLWPSIEIGLHSALLSNVSLLKDASLKVYRKMLSSSEPKVVQEGFDSLIKHLLQNLLPTINQNIQDFISKCKSVVEIIAVLNRFLQNIPNHWLRYPQPVIEDITIKSVSILLFGSRNTNIFPVWLCIALCDKKSKWFRTLLYGHVSRSFLLDALKKDSLIIKFIIQFCKNFDANDNCMSWSNMCCQKYAEISEVTHIICFLSYLLQYSQSREIISEIFDGESFSWLDALDLVLKCTQKLCLVSCLNCCSDLQEVVSKVWHHIWCCDNILSHCGTLIKILLYFNDVENLSVNGVTFIVQCLYHSVLGFNRIAYTQETDDMFVDFMCALLKYLTDFSYNFPDDVTPEVFNLLNSSLKFMNKILANPSNLFINLKFFNMFYLWCRKIDSISKTIASGYCPGMRNSLIDETEQNISDLCISMLRKPNSIIILQNLELFEMSINTLLENIMQDIKAKNSVSSRDMNVLSSALSSTYSTKSILNKTILFKLSSVVWQLEHGELDNLPKVKNVLELLMPSVYPNIFENELLLNFDCDIDKLLHCVMLYPSVIKQEFVMLEEYSILALHVVSLLTCSILSTCCLQAKFKLSEILFELQSHHCNENDVPVIDAVSVLQNHLLVKLYSVGGSEEKILPPETIFKNDEDYSWPFFKSYPVPSEYCPELPISGTADIDVTFELNGENLKDIILEYIDDEILTVDVTSQILKAAINIQKPIPALCRTLNFVCLEDIGHIVLQDEIVYGVEMVKRYGRLQNLMSSEDVKTLERLLKAGKGFLSSENRFQIDLFISTICLIFRCDIQTSWLFLETFAKSSSSLFVWYERILQAIDQNEKCFTIFNVLMEQCDIIVKKTLPRVYSALQFSGILPSTLFKYWTNLCYWNYLDFTEIAHFILVSVIFGGDYAIYFFVSILKHTESTILKNAHMPSVINGIMKNPIKNFKIQNCMDFMNELADVFHNIISKSIADVLEE